MKKNLFAVTFIGLFLLPACKRDYTNPEQNNSSISQKKKVRVAQIKPMAQALPILATGVVASKEEVTLSFKTGGILQLLHVEEGDQLKKGQLMARLNLSEINARVLSAENAYEKASRDLDRIKNLYRESAGTLEQMQNAQTAKNAAQANLDMATFDQSYSSIVSPITGKVLRRMAEKGELIAPGQPIFKVGSSGKKGTQIVRVGLADVDIVKLKLGDKGLIHFDALANTNYSVTLTEIAEASNPITGLFEVELSLNTFNKEIRNGFIASVEIIPSSAEKTIQIPMDALVEGKNKQALIYYTIDKMTVQQAIVQIEQFGDDFFTVQSSELPANALIIKEGAPFLTINDSIQIIQ